MHTYTCRGRRVGWPGGPVAYRVSGGEVASSAPLDEMTPEQAQAAIVRLVAGGMDEKALAAGVKAETYVGEAEAYEAIINLAKDRSANMIIIGSHGRTGLRRLLMGSVAEKVIGLAPCPVLVVKS